MNEQQLERYIRFVSPDRRRAIGAWVITIDYMKQLAELVDKADPDHESIALNAVNGSTKLFLSTVREEEFHAIRTSLNPRNIEPGSNAHISRWRMGIVSKSKDDGSGKQTFSLNKEFAAATHFHEDMVRREKIDASLGISALIQSDREPFVAHYADQSQTLLAVPGQLLSLPDMIDGVQHDIEFWLPEA